MNHQLRVRLNTVATASDQDTQFSLVIPCYNEAAVLPLLEARLTKCLTALGLRGAGFGERPGGGDCGCRSAGSAGALVHVPSEIEGRLRSRLCRSQEAE